MSKPNERWHRMEKLAQKTVDATLSRLPKQLRGPARAVPVIFEAIPNAATLADGTEPDTLGLFIGPEMDEQDMGNNPLPPHIILFLENLWEMVEGDESAFCEEVQITLLHELGHYLGLDELDLEERGLE